MCDTILATPSATVTRAMLFGKNSDRQRNEAQAVEIVGRADHASEAQVECTHITIPQVRHTHAVILCRPFWIWGAEMGANEYGVAIGNEGLHARSPAPEESALTGMDLLRLALERAATAAEAVEVITNLLERYGQGGNCGHLHKDYYNNGFVVADPNEAFVLETVGREWLVARAAGARSISNIYSIGRDVQRTSEGLPALVRNSGWSDDPAPCYAEVITNPHREHIGHAGRRRARSTALLDSQLGKLNAADMMRILRDHGANAESCADWTPEHATERSICAHAGSEERSGQTVGSMVSVLHSTDAVHWVTGTAAPCISIFKPVLVDAALPSQGPRLTDRSDLETLWWRHERLHRAALMGDFAPFIDAIREQRDALEADFLTRMAVVSNGGSAAERSRVVAQCWREASELEDQWFTRVRMMERKHDSPYRSIWANMNRIAGAEPSAAMEFISPHRPDRSA
jgi:secernin